MRDMLTCLSLPCSSVNGFLPSILVVKGLVFEHVLETRCPFPGCDTNAQSAGGETGEVPKSEDSDWHRP